MLKYKKLSSAEARIILEAGTEAPFSSEYYQHNAAGIYCCRQCSAPLYDSRTKFDSACGWPSFDVAIPGMLLQKPDPDGRRTEILCNNCQGHIGHVFVGEQHTPSNTRYCVNSIALQFVPTTELENKLQMAVFASGCFWGTEFWMRKPGGVVATTVGYSGGLQPDPSYQEVCTGTTGHAEAVRVYFDPRITNYAELVKIFFETHDPTQQDGQGPDRGSQYRSIIFYDNPQQQKLAEHY